MAQDYFTQEIAQPQTSTDFFAKEISNTSMPRTPADQSPEMTTARFNAAHPYLTSGENTGNQVLVNPAIQAINGLAPALRGVVKGVGGQSGGQNIQGPDMSNAPMAAKVLGDVASGGASGVAATVAGGGNPIVGYGALSALGAYGDNKPVVPAAIGGAASAIPSLLGGVIGGKVAKDIAPTLKYAPNFGTAVGMGGAAAGQAAVTGGNPVEAGASGAAFGLMSPMGGPQQVTQDHFNNEILPSAAATYREILNPTKGFIKKVEVTQGKDINDSAALLAKNGIILRKGDDGKLDNTQPISQLNTLLDPLRDQQNQMLSSDKSSQFDLEAFRNQANQRLRSNFTNDADYNKAKSAVDNEIDAAITNRGRYINGEDLNSMKTGWWKVGYDQNNLIRQPVAKQLGSLAKQAIEQAYPQHDLQGTNADMGKILDARALLENTNGNAVMGGRLGKYFAKTLGGVAGTAIGHAVPFAGEIAGPLVGWQVGGKVNDFMNDPERITTSLQNKLKNIQITNPNIQSRRNGVVTPQVMNGPTIPTPQGPAVGGPQPVGAIPTSRNMPPINTTFNPRSPWGAIVPPNVNGKGTIPMGQDRPLGLPSPTSVSLPNYLKERQNIPNADVPISLPNSFNPRAMQNMGVPPKTEAANGPLQPNIRAQFDMSKGGADLNNPEILKQFIMNAQQQGMTPAQIDHVLVQNTGKNLAQLQKPVTEQGQAFQPGIGKKFGVPLAAAAGAGLASTLSGGQAQASQIKDKDMLHAILGEVENGKLGDMRAISSALRNNGDINAAHGAKSIIEDNGKFYRTYTDGRPNRVIPTATVTMAQQALQDTKHKDYAKGANHWFSQEDLVSPKIQNMANQMKLMMVKKGNYLYKG